MAPAPRGAPVQAVEVAAVEPVVVHPSVDGIEPVGGPAGPLGVVEFVSLPRVGRVVGVFAPRCAFLSSAVVRPPKAGSPRSTRSRLTATKSWSGTLSRAKPEGSTIGRTPSSAWAWLMACEDGADDRRGSRRYRRRGTPRVVGHRCHVVAGIGEPRVGLGGGDGPQRRQSPGGGGRQSLPPGVGVVRPGARRPTSPPARTRRGPRRRVAGRVEGGSHHEMLWTEAAEDDMAVGPAARGRGPSSRGRRCPVRRCRATGSPHRGRCRRRRSTRWSPRRNRGRAAAAGAPRRRPLGAASRAVDKPGNGPVPGRRARGRWRRRAARGRSAGRSPPAAPSGARPRRPGRSRWPRGSCADRGRTCRPRRGRSCRVVRDAA